MNRPNIIFFVMDALRFRNLSCNGYFRKTSQNIDLLAEKGVLFEKFFSSNNSTEKSFIATLSGRHILLGDEKNLLLTNNEIKSFFDSGGVFLQQILKNKGYTTYCLKDLYGWQKIGFDFFYSMGALGNEKPSVWNLIQKKEKFRNFSRLVVHYLFPKRVANRIKARYGRTTSLEATEKAIKVIHNSKKTGEKFFMWVDYNDTHIPYNPKEFTGKFKAEEKNEKFFKKISGEKYHPEMINFWKGAFSRGDTINDIIARYDSAIAYDDHLISRVIESLKEQDMIENTLIFFFTDHGENLSENNLYWDHHSLYDVAIHVPLIISGKGFPKNKRIKEFIQHEDIVPTLLDYLEIDYDINSFDGKSLLPLISGKEKKIRDYIFSEEGDKVKKRAIRTNNYKYIEANSKEDAFCTYCNRIHNGLFELYDLKKDPDEKKNIFDQKKDILILMKKLLDHEVNNMKINKEKRRIKRALSKIG
jgi:arylsulfatase A-like enzyme